MNVEPGFTHDCDKCVFLGTVRRSETILVTDEVAAALTAHVEGEASIADLNKALEVKPPVRFDLYVCRGQALGPSIIARYGDEGADYKSVPSVVVDGVADPELNLGFKLALESGNIPMCGVTGDDDDD